MNSQLILLLIGLVSASLTGCNQKNRTDAKASVYEAVYDTTKIAVISLDTAWGFPFDKSHPNATLTEEDFKGIDSLLTVWIEKYNKNVPEQIRIKLSDYKKQMVSVTNSKGEKEVWVNCFCYFHNSSWKKNIRIVHDGGNCYFNLKLNLKTKKIYDFIVNGDA